MNNEPVAYACQIVEADFDTNIIKIEMLDKNYKVSAGIKFLCNEYTYPAKTLTDEEIEEVFYTLEYGHTLNEFARAILKKTSEK